MVNLLVLLLFLIKAYFLVQCGQVELYIITVFYEKKEQDIIRILCIVYHRYG